VLILDRRRFAMPTVTVNGQAHEIDADPSTPLLYVLRDDLGLNGAKFGCGLGQCGACTVLLDGKATLSCITPLAAIGSRPVRTIEDLGTPARPGPVQAAFIQLQAAQCGYCIAGMVMRAQALLDRNPQPSDDEIRAHMQPNLCRCGTHMRILAAVRRAAELLAQAGPAAPARGTRS
jgi:nicotinate dehydrogenase subunit A